MPRHPESVESSINSYLRRMETRGGYSRVSLINYRNGMKAAFRIVTSIQPDATPSTVTPVTLKDTLVWMKENKSVATTKVYFFFIRELLKSAGNHAYEEINVTYPTDIRPNVDWLSLDEATELLNSDLTPMERLVIHLELCHGLRRIEVSRLSISDIHTEGSYITVLGKGKGGGKFRSVHFHPRFHPIFSDWMVHRTQLTQKCRVSSEYDNSLLVYERSGKLHRYTVDSLSRILRNTSRRVGIEFSSHTLRRTFGREMFHSGVSIVTIAKIMGHSSTEMTMRYIGVDLDDMATAMSQFILG